MPCNTMSSCKSGCGGGQVYFFWGGGGGGGQWGSIFDDNSEIP